MLKYCCHHFQKFQKLFCFSFGGHFEKKSVLGIGFGLQKMMQNITFSIFVRKYLNFIKEQAYNQRKLYMEPKMADIFKVFKQYHP